MTIQDTLQIAQIGYYTLIGLTPVGTAIGFYIHQKANKNKYSLEILKTFEHKISPKMYHLKYHITNKEQDKISKVSTQIIVNELKENTNNSKVIHLALKKKNIRNQIKQIQTYLKYRNIFKSFDIISIYIAQHMINKSLVKKELKEPFEFMYHKYYNEYVSKNMPCKEYIRFCKKWA